MDLNQFFNRTLFSLGNYDVTVGNVTLLLFALILLLGIYWAILSYWLPKFIKSQDVSEDNRRRIYRLAYVASFFVLILALIFSLGLELELYEFVNPESGETRFMIRVSHLIGLVLIWVLARLGDLLLSRIYLQNIFEQREGKKLPPSRYRDEPKKFSTRAVQSVVYLVAVIFLISSFKLDQQLFSFPVGESQINITVTKILFAVLVLLIARLVNWILEQIVLHRYYERQQVDVGSQYAINQLVRYLIYIIGVLVAMQMLGIKMTLVWGGAAALLLGVGLGLQQTFNDFFSGILLLLERSVEVGDVVNVGGLVGTVRHIGLRTSKIQTRDNIVVIVPNSKLVVDNVVNWSHNDNKARFFVAVGVAYGSDTERVKKLLLEVARGNEKVLNFPSPFVRFTDFADSSLNFELHFWSNEFIGIEDVKSDVRFQVDQAFRDHGVTIPFPQRDVWFKNAGPENQENREPLP